MSVPLVNRSMRIKLTHTTTICRHYIAPACLVSLLIGCTSLSTPPDETPATQQQKYSQPISDDGTLLTDGSIRHDTIDVQVASLWGSAEQARLQGNHKLASELVLRAIELQPTDGVLLSRAAELQLQLNEPVLAESYAVKSNALSETNRTMLLRNWLIIEHAREMRGDLLGVRTAHQKVQQFQY